MATGKPSQPADFHLLACDPRTGATDPDGQFVRSEGPGLAARLGRLWTTHGQVETPAFMPVATQGTVKGLTIPQIRATGAQIVLANTYHLHLRPGEATVAAAGGLHPFMGWDGPLLSDSGGFQIYSLAALRKIREASATFRSHIDGRQIELSPERAVEIQQALGTDIAMVLDHVVALPAGASEVEDAMLRSLRWAERSRAHATRADQALFCIVQGGLDPDLRRFCAEALVALDFAGYAVGGLSVGEEPRQMYRVLEQTVPYLPEGRARYLMGVGTPQDLVEGIARGVDLFDCVLPSRNGRNALAFTRTGPLRLRNRQFAEDFGPLEADCPCLACGHSRAYLRHLFMAREMLGPILLTLHNLTYYQRLLAEARLAIGAGCFAEFRSACRGGWGLPAGGGRLA